MKEYVLVLVEVTDAVKDGDELMELAPGVRFVTKRVMAGSNAYDDAYLTNRFQLDG